MPGLTHIITSGTFVSSHYCTPESSNNSQPLNPVDINNTTIPMIIICFFTTFTSTLLFCNNYFLKNPYIKNLTHVVISDSVTKININKYLIKND